MSRDDKALRLLRALGYRWPLVKSVEVFRAFQGMPPGGVDARLLSQLDFVAQIEQVGPYDRYRNVRDY